MRKINHIGIVCNTPAEGSNYIDGLKVHITDFSKSPNKIEWLCFEEGSPMHELIQTKTHIAYEVPCLTAAMEGKNVICEPFQGGEGLMCAFIEEEGIAIELMCFDK